MRASAISFSVALHACLILAVLTHADWQYRAVSSGPTVTLVGQSIGQATALNGPPQSLEASAQPPAEPQSAVTPFADAGKAPPAAEIPARPPDAPEDKAGLPVADVPLLPPSPPGPAVLHPVDTASAPPEPGMAASEQHAPLLPVATPQGTAAADVQSSEIQPDLRRPDGASMQGSEALPVAPPGAATPAETPAALPADAVAATEQYAPALAALAPRDSAASALEPSTLEPDRAKPNVTTKVVDAVAETTSAQAPIDTPVLQPGPSTTPAESRASVLPPMTAHENDVATAQSPPVEPEHPAGSDAAPSQEIQPADARAVPESSTTLGDVAPIETRHIATAAPTIVPTENPTSPPVAPLALRADVPASVAPIPEEGAAVQDMGSSASAIALASRTPEIATARAADGGALPEPRVVSEAPPAHEWMAALEIPSKLNAIRSFVENYDDGSCFFVSPAGVTPDGGRIEGFSSSVDKVKHFETAFRNALQVEPAVIGQKIWSGQCPAVEFLHQTNRDNHQTPRIEIDHLEVKAGAPVSGTVRGFKTRAIRLFLVSENGGVTDVTGTLRDRGEDRRFEVPVAIDKAGGPFPQMLLAVAGQAGIAGGEAGGAVPARGFFDTLLKSGQSWDSAGGFFLLSR